GLPGRYVRLRQLGRGGMGEVFLARDVTTGGICALKRLTRRTQPDARAALATEFDLIARVRHPAVVAVHELGFTRDGVPFYTMEYVPGLPAQEAVRAGEWATLCFVGARVAHGIEALHVAGVVHGDLKPSNLLVVP